MDRHIEVSTDPAGNISISDAFNHNIKSVQVVILAKNDFLKNIQSHSAGQFQVELKDAPDMNIEFYNVFGDMVCSSKLNMVETTIKMNVIQGIYYYRIVGADSKLISAGELFLS